MRVVWVYIRISSKTNSIFSAMNIPAGRTLRNSVTARHPSCRYLETYLSATRKGGHCCAGPVYGGQNDGVRPDVIETRHRIVASARPLVYHSTCPDISRDRTGCRRPSQQVAAEDNRAIRTAIRQQPYGAGHTNPIDDLNAKVAVTVSAAADFVSLALLKQTGK